MHKTTTVSLLAVLALTPGLAVRAQEQLPKRQASLPKGQQVYQDLRHRALKAERADVGLNDAGKSSAPWGVLMETSLPEGSYSLVALQDGSASIYYSNGGGMIGGSGHEPIRKAAKAMVDLAAKFKPRAKKTKEFPLPKEGHTVFYLLTDDGVLYSSAPEQDLGKEKHEWSPLFHAGHDVITEFLRIEKTDAKNDPAK